MRAGNPEVQDVYKRQGLINRLTHITINATEDPFTGSGTTMAAAHVLDRVGYGCEISPAYCDVILDVYKRQPLLIYLDNWRYLQI